MFAGMGQAFAGPATSATYISGAKDEEDAWVGNSNFGEKVIVSETKTDYKYREGDSIYGYYTGYSENLKKGTVVIDSGNISGAVYGGVKVSGDAESNTVTINGGKIQNSVYGCYSLSGNAESNTVTINGGEVHSGVFGGYAAGNANNNTFEMTDGTINVDTRYVAVTVGRGKGNADGNTATIKGGTIASTVRVGYGAGGNANNNILNISGGTIENVVQVGNGAGGDANNNILNISGGSIDGYVVAGMAKQGTASDNIVNLIGTGGELKVVTGYKDGVKVEETVAHSGDKDITLTGTVYGGNGNESSTGNTLNVAGKDTTVRKITCFQNLNFYIQDSLNYGDTMMKVTVDETTDISSAKVGVIVEAKPKDNGDDKTINLMTTNAGITWGNDYTITVKDGVKLIDSSKSIVELMNDNKDLVLTLAEINDDSASSIVTPAAKPLFEAMDKNKDSLSSNIKNFCKNLLDGASGSVEAKAANIQAAVSGAFQASEITGTTSTAVSVTNNVSNLTFSRMSLVDTGSSANGGKGVGLMAPDSGADVWARYVHGKDKADGMKMDGGSAEYSNNYNGVVVGADFKKVGKFQSGISFSYVKGSGNNTFKDVLGATSRYGHTDFHTYNFGYYGSVKNDDTNTMFDLSYGTTSADSDTNGVGGAQSFSSKSKIFNAGVTAEKSFDVSGMKLVPYTGLRYMHVDGGEYTDSLGINHNVDKQNVFMLPVGVKLSKENKLSHDWTLTPKLDLSYTWNMGDTDSQMSVSVPGLTASNLSYSVMDKGSFMGVAGVEAERKNWTYGVSYAYQKGSHQDSKKIIADIKLKF